MSIEILRAIIIDDEPMARELLETHCQASGFIQVVASCKSALDAFQVLHEQVIDVMFLDIQMPGITGLNFLRSLKSPPKVIFTTAYANHAIEAFELEALDYLLKPVTYERFLKAALRVSGKKVEEAPVQLVKKADPTSIFLKINKRVVQIVLDDILYFESLGDYVKIFTGTEVLVCYTTLNKLVLLLPESLFQRSHRSYVISLKKISFMEGNFVKIGETDVPIGQTYREALLKKLNLREEL